MNKKNIKKFEENGYHTFNFINKSKLNEVKKDLYVMVLDSLKSNAPEFLKKNKKKIKNKLFILNEGLIYLEKKDHKHLTKIYDVIAKTTSFLNLTSEVFSNIVASKSPALFNVTFSSFINLSLVE